MSTKIQVKDLKNGDLVSGFAGDLLAEDVIVGLEYTCVQYFNLAGNKRSQVLYKNSESVEVLP